MWLELVRGRAPVGLPYMLALFTCSASTVFSRALFSKAHVDFFFFFGTQSHHRVCVVCVLCVRVLLMRISIFFFFFCVCVFGITLSMLC